MKTFDKIIVEGKFKKVEKEIDDWSTQLKFAKQFIDTEDKELAVKALRGVYDQLGALLKGLK